MQAGLTELVLLASFLIKMASINRLTSRNLRWRFRTDHLWLLAALTGFGFIISLAPQPPHDFWWHLKAGQLIAGSGHIPHTNLFAWTLDPGTPYIYGAWLAELISYLLYQAGGLALVFFTRTALALAAFFLVGLIAWRQSGSWRLAGLVTALACVMTANNLIVRPQNWAWLPFSLFILILSAYAGGRLRGFWLAAVPLIMVFWVNVHGSFILGAVIIIVYLVGETGRAWLHLDGALPWNKIAWLGATTGLTFVAMAANPQGAGIFGYVIKLMTDQPSQSLIVEWRTPTPTDLPSIVFYATVLVLIAAVAYTRRKPTISEMLLSLAFLWLAWTGVRYVVWFGMVIAPVLAKAISGLIPQRVSVPSHASPANLILATCLIALLVPIQPWFIDRMPLPEGYWHQVRRMAFPGPLLSTHTPVEAVEYLQKHPGGRLFNDMGFGSYLIWALPEQGVFVDPRVELYPYEQWMDYVQISNGVRYNQILERYGADRLLLDVVEQNELARLLENDPGWHKEYEDDIAQIWQKVQ